MPDSPAMMEPAKANAERLPAGVGWLCEPLLDLEPGRRLLALNPALAVATSLQAGTAETWRRRLDGLLALRVRDLAAKLGFGGSRRAVRTLAKLEPESTNVHVLRLLGGLLHGAQEKWLFHLPALNATVLEILAAPKRRELVTFGLLVELCRDLDDATGEMVVMTIDEIRTLRLSLTPKRVRARIDSFQALMAEDDDLWDRAERRQLFLPFPVRASPELRVPDELPGRIRCKPLRDMAAIRAHGRRQANCLAMSGAFECDLHLGARFLYEVTASTTGGELQATLAVVPEGSGFLVEDIRLAGNEVAPGWLVEAVDHAVMTLSDSSMVGAERTVMATEMPTKMPQTTAPTDYSRAIDILMRNPPFGGFGADAGGPRR